MKNSIPVSWASAIRKPDVLLGFHKIGNVIIMQHLAPKRPFVELVCVTLYATGMAIYNSGDPLHPAPYVPNLRYRSHVGPAQFLNVNVLVSAIETDDADVIRCWDQL